MNDLSTKQQFPTDLKIEGRWRGGRKRRKWVNMFLDVGMGQSRRTETLKK